MRDSILTNKNGGLLVVGMGGKAVSAEKREAKSSHKT
jgi:hypothetical protein